MFARKVQSVIWMDRKYQAMGKDGRRQFEALYIFCDGFVSINEAVSAAAKAGCNSSSFLYICFCGMWYPITLDSYYSRAVLTKEKVYYVKEAFGPLYIVRTPDFVPSRAVIPDTPAADIKTWQDGICNDLKLIDKDSSSEMSLKERLEVVERTAMECRITALKHDRFRTEPEDREELKNLLNTMSGKDIADITWIVVRGSRSYGEPAMLFVSKEEMCSYLCDKTDNLPSYIVEGCIIYNMKWPYSADLDEEYNRYRDRLEEKMIDEG